VHYGVDGAIDSGSAAGGGVDAGIVAETLQELAADVALDAVHIGMLGNGLVAEAVADFLEQAKLGHVVLDPILKSSSGRICWMRRGRGCWWRGWCRWRRW